MNVLVVTVVRDPRDARVGRLMQALRAAGHQITYAAPFGDYDLPALPDLRCIDLPRARDRRRLAAYRAARRVLRREAPGHDVVLVVDPELTVPAAALHHPCVIWDVQEDTAAAVTLKPYLPALVRAPVAGVVRALEVRAERRMHLVLAEDAYAERFTRPHPVVPNSTVVPSQVPAAGPGRAVYVGHLTRARGAFDLIEMARRTAPDVRLDVIGHAHDDVAVALREAQRAGVLTWHGFVDNAAALRLVQGATAGMSLLHDEPNYRHSRPTKILEYLAHGVPAVTTPLPMAVDVIERSGGGVVVPFADPDAAANAVLALHADADLRRTMAGDGHRWVRVHYDWSVDGPAWVRQVEAWARRSPGSMSSR